MRIAFFSDNFYPEISGISDSIIATGKELARMGHEITFFAPRYSKKEFATSGVEFKELDLGPGIRIRRLFSIPVPAPTLQGRAIIPDISLPLDPRNAFDIIHTHSIFGAGLTALFLAKTKCIPLVGTNHTHIESFVQYLPIHGKATESLAKKYVAWYYNRCARASAPSAFLIENMKDSGFKVPSTIISNPIEDGFFTDHRKTGAFRALYVGRISREKNIETMVEAFIPFAKKHEEAELVMVGHGPLSGQIAERIQSEGLSQRMRIIGPFFGANKAKLYEQVSEADISIMPSTSETQSMSALQAFASGMPVIGARAGALPAVIGEERGLLFDPGDPEDLGMKLEEFFQDPDKRALFGRKARAFAESLRTENIAKEWEKVYDSMYRKN